MTNGLRYIGQALIYGLVAVALGVFSIWPSYTNFPADQALIKVSFIHGAKPKGECHRLSAEEIAELAPNMRRAVDCPRERLPVVFEFVIDGAIVHSVSLPPSGVAGDGPSRFYQRFPVAPGRRELVIRLRDTARETGFDYQSAAIVDLVAGQNLAIDFRAETGEFVLK